MPPIERCKCDITIYTKQKRDNQMITIDKNAVQIQYKKRQPKSKQKPLKKISFQFPAAIFQRIRWISLQEVIEYFQCNRPEKWQYGRKIYNVSIFRKRQIKKMKRVDAELLKVNYDHIKYGKQVRSQDQKVNRVLKLDCLHCSSSIVIHQFQNLSQKINGGLNSKIQIKFCSRFHIHEITLFARQLLQKQVKQLIDSNIFAQTKTKIIDRLSAIYPSLSRNSLTYAYDKHVGRLLLTFQEIRQKYRKQNPSIYFDIFHSRKLENDNNKQSVSFLQQNEKQINKNNLILMVTPSMIENYKKYGDTISFDVTYRLVKKYHQYSLKRRQAAVQQWGAGFFIGQNQNLRIVLFGVALIKNETAQIFRQLFQRFFTIMLKNGGHFPETIVTDDQMALKRGIQELGTNNNFHLLKQIINQKLSTQTQINQTISNQVRFQPKWLHLLDQFHKLQNLKRAMIQINVGTQQQRTIMLQAFAKLMKQNNNVILKQKVQQLLYYFQKPQFKQIMNSFLKQKHKYCASVIGRKFYGFSVSSVKVEAFNSLIKRRIQFSTYPSNFFSKCLQIQNSMNLRNCNQLNTQFQPKNSYEKKLKSQGKIQIKDIPKQFLLSSYRRQNMNQQQSQQYMNWNFDDKFIQKPKSIFERLQPNRVKGRPVIGIEQLADRLGKNVFKKLVQQIAKTQCSEGLSKVSETFIYTQNEYKQLSKLSQRQVQIIEREWASIQCNKLEQQKECGVYYVVEGQYAYKLMLVNPKKGYRSNKKQFTFWVCQCNYIFHTGIPCCHLLTLLRYRFENIVPYFKKRWFIEKRKNSNSNTLIQQNLQRNNEIISIQQNAINQQAKQDDELKTIQVFSLSKKRKINQFNKKQKQKHKQDHAYLVQEPFNKQQIQQFCVIQQSSNSCLDQLDEFDQQFKESIRIQLQKDNSLMSKICLNKQNNHYSNLQEEQSIITLSKYRKIKHNFPQYRSPSKRQVTQQMQIQPFDYNDLIKKQIAAVFKMETTDFQQHKPMKDLTQKKKVIHTVQKYKQGYQDLKQYERVFNFDLDFSLQNKFKQKLSKETKKLYQFQNSTLNQEAQKLLNNFDFDMDIEIPNFLDQENQDGNQKNDFVYNVQRLVSKANKNSMQNSNLKINKKALRQNEKRQQFLFKRKQIDSDQQKLQVIKDQHQQPFDCRVKRKIDKNFGINSNFKLKFCIDRVNSLFQQRMNKMKQCRQVLELIEYQQRKQISSAQCAQNLRMKIEKLYN